MSEKFEPILVSTDKQQIENQIGMYDDRVVYFQLITNLFNKIGIGTLKTEDLGNLVNTPEDFLFKKIIEKNNLQDNFKHLNPSEGYRMLNKPTGVEELIQTISNYKQKETPERFFYRHFEHFIIDEDGIVKLSNETIDFIKDSHSVYLQNEQEKQLYDNLKIIEESLNKIQTVRNQLNLPDELFASLYDYDRNTGITKLKHDFLKIYRR